MNSTLKQASDADCIQHLKESDEIEVVSIKNLTPEQSTLLDLHSVVNLVGVLASSLELLSLECDGLLDSLRDRVFDLSDLIKSSATSGEVISFDESLPGSIRKGISDALAAHPSMMDLPDAKEMLVTVNVVLDVFVKRISELNARLSKPTAWEWFNVKQIEATLRETLAAIEQNAHGRFKIVENIAEQTEADYQINFEVSSVDGDRLLMPPVLQDVLRDLIANARKYTPQGGHISAGLLASSEALRVVVEDNGLGIPRDELPNVAEFGYRASNTASKRTYGGGFGLTKAFCVCKQFGGRMWLRSRVDVGTRITLWIPRPLEESRVVT